MLLSSGPQFQFLLLLLVALACRSGNAQTAADACKEVACLDFRALSVSCGYNIDLEQSRVKTYDETMCICGDSSYTRISTSCFNCISALGVAGYNQTQWGDDCYEAYLQQPPPQKSAAAGAGNGGISLVIYAMLSIAIVNVGLLL